MNILKKAIGLIFLLTPLWTALGFIGYISGLQVLFHVVGTILIIVGLIGLVFLGVALLTDD